MILSCLILGHELHLHQPAGIFTTLNGVEEVTLVGFPVFGNHFLSFLVGQVLYALQSPQMKFHPYPFIILIIKTIRMASEAVHVAE